MAPRDLIHRIRVDSVDDLQPVARYLLLLLRAFEDEVLDEVARLGFADVTPADLQVLRFVRPEGSQAVELARLAGISKQAVGKTVASLQERGYLRRRPDAVDARSKVIEFSPKGRRLIRASIGIIRGIESRYTRAIGQKRMVELRAGLSALLGTHGGGDATREAQGRRRMSAKQPTRARPRDVRRASS